SFSMSTSGAPPCSSGPAPSGDGSVVVVVVAGSAGSIGWSAAMKPQARGPASPVRHRTFPGALFEGGWKGRRRDRSRQRDGAGEGVATGGCGGEGRRRRRAGGGPRPHRGRIGRRHPRGGRGRVRSGGRGRGGGTRRDRLRPPGRDGGQRGNRHGHGL